MRNGYRIGILCALCILGGLFLGSCGAPTAEEMASLAAKGYYDHLIRGEYMEFLEGVDLSETVLAEGEHALPSYPSYHDQLLDNYRQFMSMQRTAHNGIREVRIVRAKTDTIHHYTSVFLTLCFGDSTNEEIVVPMVEKDGGWRMRYR